VRLKRGMVEISHPGTPMCFCNQHVGHMHQTFRRRGESNP
jgi:hypothetical protein